MLKDLVKAGVMKDAELTRRLRDWAIEAKGAYDERTTRLHAIWLLEAGNDVLRGLVVTRETVDEEDIFDGSEAELQKLADRLKDLQLLGRGLMQEVVGGAILRPVAEYEGEADRQKLWSNRST